ncbi:Lrp/AsnC family transcriptional regulator [Natrinema salifodinae]|uniref:Transcriptional regulator, AsnC family n=1 Tax=Natrinema salifodinae TaxID=1202768 RepID=A0A1I0QW29_9EURY|nr:winged helix-turn-helix transcriptional regulator [Natrinema salifodinae]SEW31504.1 transcriptional regulator, AsnC family [Natrinema salifodinae]
MSGTEPEIDEVDRGILHFLQKDARNNATREIGEAVGVSAGTVRNRIEKLEEAGVIRGYVPDINYEKAGYQLVILFTCTATNPSETLAKDILSTHGVVTVRKLLAGEENYHVTVVGTDTADVSEIANSIRESGLEIVRSEVLDEELVQPFNHFGEDVPRDDE